MNERAKIPKSVRIPTILTEVITTRWNYLRLFKYLLEKKREENKDCILPKLPWDIMKIIIEMALGYVMPITIEDTIDLTIKLTNEKDERVKKYLDDQKKEKEEREWKRRIEISRKRQGKVNRIAMEQKRVKSRDDLFKRSNVPMISFVGKPKPNRYKPGTRIYNQTASEEEDEADEDYHPKEKKQKR